MNDTDALFARNETSICITLDTSFNCSCSIAEYRSRHSALVERWKLCGFFQDDDFLDINCHWLQFEPAPLVNHLVLFCIFVVILLVGCLCNAVAAYVLASSRHLRTPANIIILNLAISDFLMLIKMPIFLYNSLLQGPALGSKGCAIYGFMSGITGTTSIMSLAAIAFDRYRVISNPLQINKKPTRAGAYRTVALIWIYSSVFASLPFFGVGKYIPEGYLTSCSFDYLSEDRTTRTFILVFFVAAWVVPCVIIAVCYSAIVWYVREARKEFGREQFAISVAKNCSSGWRQGAVEVAIAKVVMGLVAFWMISWTPYAFVALMGISGNQNKLTPTMTMLPALFAKFSACINPIVYIMNHPKMKKEIFRRWLLVMSSWKTNGVVDASVCINDGTFAGGQAPDPWRRPRVFDSGSSSREESFKVGPSHVYRTEPPIPVAHSLEVSRHSLFSLPLRSKIQSKFVDGEDQSKSRKDVIEHAEACTSKVAPFTDPGAMSSAPISETSGSSRARKTPDSSRSPRLSIDTTNVLNEARVTESDSAGELELRVIMHNHCTSMEERF